MTSTHTIPALADEARTFFTRRNGQASIVLLVEDRPDWVYQIVYAAHGSMLPDDWRNAMTLDALHALADAEEGAEDDAIGDSCLEAPVYNAELLRWLASNLNRPAYVDEACEEQDPASKPAILTQIAMGYEREQREVFEIVLAELRERAEELADEAIETGACEPGCNCGCDAAEAV